MLTTGCVSGLKVDEIGLWRLEISFLQGDLPYFELGGLSQVVFAGLDDGERWKGPIS